MLPVLYPEYASYFLHASIEGPWKRTYSELKAPIRDDFDGRIYSDRRSTRYIAKTDINSNVDIIAGLWSPADLSPDSIYTKEEVLRFRKHLDWSSSNTLSDCAMYFRSELILECNKKNPDFFSRLVDSLDYPTYKVDHICDAYLTVLGFGDFTDYNARDHRSRPSVRDDPSGKHCNRNPLGPIGYQSYSRKVNFLRSMARGFLDIRINFTKLSIPEEIMYPKFWTDAGYPNRYVICNY